MISKSAQLTSELISIDSSNPSLVSTGAGEAAVAAFASTWLTDRGFDCHLVGPADRPSIIAVHAGSGGGASLMLNGHLDTVSLESFEGSPLEAVIQDGRLHGRGSYDMKAGVAAMMVAAARASRAAHRGDIILALVADEEAASDGTEEILRHVTADAAIVAEPTDEAIVLAHRGFVWAEVTVHGLAAHGSRRDLGVDAIVGAGEFLSALGAFDRELQTRAPHPLLGTGNVHASLIRGGEEISSYPAACTISLERRTLPGESAPTVAAELQRIADEVTTRTQCSFEVRTTFERAPFSVDPSARIVRTLAAAVEERRGTPARTQGALYWTDCALLSDAGIPAVLYGVTGAGAHAADEWIDLESLDVITDVLAATIANLVE